MSEQPNQKPVRQSTAFRNVVKATDQLAAISGRSLDIGCGAGRIVEYLLGPPFTMRPHGIDASVESIRQARSRLRQIPAVTERLLVADCLELPFEDDFFSLVTAFDSLNDLEESELDRALAEISRVTRKGGTFFGSVSCEHAARKTDWWIARTRPDRAIYDGHRQELVIWKRAPHAATAQLFGCDESLAHHPANSKQLYQKIYDDNPWYGNAEEGRCPGVRLLPHYQDWLIGPVIDLGCGRGQTVEKLRELGFEAEGIDQISKHPGMLVGDITRPIKSMNRFQSAVCVDCIEHLYDDQVQGLFANMKQVPRQAFSIHNGESTGTGLELHVNRRPFEQWRAIIEEHFVIEKEVALHQRQMLYLTRSH